MPRQSHSNFLLNNQMNYSQQLRIKMPSDQSIPHTCPAINLTTIIREKKKKTFKDISSNHL
ncbi:hypothetical protein Hanom_Chr08g00728401 [Helianthus anomalus]